MKEKLIENKNIVVGGSIGVISAILLYKVYNWLTFKTPNLEIETQTEHQVVTIETQTEHQVVTIETQTIDEEIKEQLINILHQLHPKSYPKEFNKWVNSETKKVIESNNYQEMEKLLILNKTRLENKILKELNTSEILKISDIDNSFTLSELSFEKTEVNLTGVNEEC